MEHSSGAPVLLHHLRHETAHLFGGAFLHLACDVSVGSQCEACVEVTKHTGHCFHVHAILERQRCECVPLRYNKDKRKKPVFSRVSAFVVAYSIPFPTLIVNEKSVE